MQSKFFTRILFIAALAVVLTPATVFGADGATIILTPENWVVPKGDTFTVNIMIDPTEYDVRTAKVELHYPAALVEFDSFELAEGWYSVVQAGYDQHSPERGYVLKSAGFPGGIDHEVLFGKMTFRGSVSGVGLIKIAGGTALLDDHSDNVFDNTFRQTAVRVYDPTTMSDEEIEAVKALGSEEGDHLFDVIINPEQKGTRGLSPSVIALIGSLLFLSFVGTWYVVDRRRG